MYVFSENMYDFFQKARTCFFEDHNSLSKKQQGVLNRRKLFQDTLFISDQEELLLLINLLRDYSIRRLYT